MNPSWISKPEDRKMVREQYLNNLKLETSNMQTTINGMLLYTQTGNSVPNALPDTRTPSQKRLDLERIKIELRGELKDITTAIVANDVVQDLSPEELIFTANHISKIMEDLKKFNALKAAPAPTVLDYIRKYIRKFAETKGIEYGLQSDTRRGMIATPHQIVASKPTKEFIHTLIEYIKEIKNIKDMNIPLCRQIVEQLTLLYRYTMTLTTADEIDTLDPVVINPILKIINAAFQHIPSEQRLTDMVSELKILVSTNSAAEVNRALETLLQEVTLDSTTIRDLQTAASEVTAALLSEISSSSSITKKPAEKSFGTPAAPLALPQVSTSLYSAVPTSAAMSPDLSTFQGSTLKDQKIELAAALKATGMQLTDKAGNNIGIASISAKGGQSSAKAGGGKVTYKMEDTNAFEIMDTFYQSQSVSGHGIRGRGLSSKIAKRIAVPIDVEKIKPYMPFGKYYIHQPKLNNNLIQLRTQKGGVVQALPTSMISEPLTDILQKVVGGSIVSYDNINDLSDQDKRHFSKIIKLAQLERQVSVPRSISNDKRELDRFAILKGEISAGQNNKAVLKEFKLMLLKFLHDGRVPKREAHEILMELAAQGL